MTNKTQNEKQNCMSCDKKKRYKDFLSCLSCLRKAGKPFGIKYGGKHDSN